MTARPNPDRVVFASPLVRIGAFRCAPDHPHFHDTDPLDAYHFVFPRNACWIEHEGQRPFVADSTTVPLYNPGRPFRRGAIDPAGDFTDWFSVSTGLARDIVSEFDPHAGDRVDRLFTRGFISASSALFMNQRKIFNHVTGDAAPDVLGVEESVIELLSEVVGRTFEEDQAARAASADLAARVRAHLARTFLMKEGVGELAGAVGVSPFHLCRVFRRETGYSLHQYRTELRLRWSLQPLADEVDILSVALAAGFSHHSHFTSAFRKTFGIRPSEFRKPRRVITSPASPRSK